MKKEKKIEEHSKKSSFGVEIEKKEVCKVDKKYIEQRTTYSLKVKNWISVKGNKIIKWIVYPIALYGFIDIIVAILNNLK